MAQKEEAALTMITAEALIEQLKLRPHPEGGYYRETYRSSGTIPKKALPVYYKDTRPYSTAIYYMLTEGAKSRFHRLLSDEFWHFYLGDPVTLVMIHPAGQVEEVVLGHDLAAGQQVQVLIPAGSWFGAYPSEGCRYALVGCTVAPGFDFDDFEIADRAHLLVEYPHAEALIMKLTDETVPRVTNVTINS